MDLYHSTFHPSPTLSEPYPMVSVNAVLADDEQEAARLFTSVQQRFLFTVRGRMRSLDPPVDDIRALWTRQEAAAVGEQLAQSYVGTPGTVRNPARWSVAANWAPHRAAGPDQLVRVHPHRHGEAHLVAGR
jgi:alkanesulfonate monooxygenase SsuD/methylene tetrahydromethanopterin reductase-like flavin-dependent oxidoreductase (luciferase family)